MIDAVLVKKANRMMTVASLLEDGIELSFADGAEGLIPYSDLSEIGERANLSTLELPQPVRDGSEDGARRDDRDTLGLRPSLL